MTVLKASGPVGSRVVAQALLMLLAVVLMAVLVGLSSGRAAEAATTFTVNSTGDAADINITNGRCDSESANGDQCTLRAAIEEANDTNGADTIDFDIGGNGAVRTISPNSALPTITDSVTIDGYTQSGASPNSLAEGNDAVLNVVLDGINAGSVVVGLMIEATDTTIKGLVIRRFDDYGIQLLSVGEASNRVEGNFIGVNRDGITDRGNSDGVFIAGGSNTVGGTASGARNVISGNGESGIVISSTVSEENRVEGNYIGTGADKTGNVGNTEDGVAIQNGADLTAVGGTLSGAANRIAHNGGDGVSVAGSNSEGNHVLSNTIFNNAELGIDLLGGTEDANGVTSNDTDDPDTGPNTLQNFPVITSAVRSNTTGDTTISGTLNSNPTQDFVVQCFLTNGAPAPAHGEGSRLLDTVLVSTNTNGNRRFTCDSSRPLLGQVTGQTVSAIATNIVTGDSSEFSKNRAITTVP
jgi:trimeric autotransporter adhesin